MTSAPKVSVLMLTYNHGPYIRDAIDGVLGQDFPFEVEILIGDDASTDDTGHIVDDYADRYPDRIRVLRPSRNLGMHANHRSLVHSARGEYVAYCEGDDYWHDPLKLFTQSAVLDGSPDVGLVHTAFDHIIQRRGRWRARRDVSVLPEIPQGSVFESLLLGNFIQTCTVMVRRTLLDQAMNSTPRIDAYPYADWPLFLHVSRTSNLSFVPESTSTYRRVAGSSVNRGWASRLSAVQGCARMIEDFCDAADESSDTRADAVAAAQLEVLRSAILAGDPGMVSESRRSLERNPGLRQTPETRFLLWAAGSRRREAVVKGLRDMRSMQRELRLYRREPRVPAGRSLKP